MRFGRIRTALAGLALSALLAAVASDGADGQQAEPSLIALQEAAFAAVEAGDDAVARAIARQILTQDPKNALAEFVLTVVAMRSGQVSEARPHARRAFRFAESNDQKFQTAMIAADLADREARPVALRYWLRQAADQAPGDAQRSAILRILAEEKAKSPVRLSFGAQFAPSSNVNNGASSPYNIIDGIAPIGLISAEGQALSGWKGTLRLGAATTLAETDRSRTELTAGLTLYRVALSDSASKKAPSLSGADFADTILKFGIKHSVLTPDGRGKTTVSLDLGRGWAGTGSIRDLADLQVTQIRDLGDGHALSYGLAVSWMDPEKATRSNTRRSTLSLSYFRPVGTRDRMFAEILLSDTDASAGSDYGSRKTRSALARLGWQFGKPVGPVSVSASVGLNYADYPDFTFGFLPVPGGRQDLSGFAEVTMGLPDASWAGFQPTLTMRFVETDSNVSAFTTRDASLGLGIQSEF